MRIFIQNYSLSKLINKISSLKPYLVDTTSKLEIISDEGQYYIDNSKAYKKVVSDKPTKLYENYYNDLGLLVDYSEIIIVETNQIPNYNIEMFSTYFYFALNETTKTRFVVQSYDVVIDDLTNIKPFDFYFEIEGDVEINNMFFKDEINVFLYLLN